MTRPAAAHQDLEHLRILPVFHYILGGITAFLCFCFPLFQVISGILVATGSNHRPDSGGRVFGVLSAVFGCITMTVGWALAAGMIAAGRFIAARRLYLFCIMVAAFSCIFVPLGTALGVFSLVVLMRPSVKALFDAPKAA